MNHTIDAKGKRLGKLASEVAVLLMGKDDPTYQKHLEPKAKVTVLNIDELDITEKKMKEKEYTRYTGYPSGLRKETMEAVIKKHGRAEILRRAVRGMLPKNKLRPIMLKNLIVE
jgi:large subunit ribosomal protein L13